MAWGEMVKAVTMVRRMAPTYMVVFQKGDYDTGFWGEDMGLEK